MEKEKSRPGSSALGAVTLFLADRQAAGPAHWPFPLGSEGATPRLCAQRGAGSLKTECHCSF
jgi:hypothetical protein